MKSHNLPEITKQHTSEILNGIVHLSTCAAPLNHMTPEERLAIPRVGPQREDFARAALEAAFTHPDCIPRSVNLMPMIGGLIVHRGLAEAREKLLDLLQQVEDTRHHLGAGIYTQSLELYHFLKAHRSSDAELTTAVGEMKTRLRSPQNEVERSIRKLAQ